MTVSARTRSLNCQSHDLVAITLMQVLPACRAPQSGAKLEPTSSRCIDGTLKSPSIARLTAGYGAGFIRAEA